MISLLPWPRPGLEEISDIEEDDVEPRRLDTSAKMQAGSTAPYMKRS